jgi:hypothetical protein
MAEDLAVNGTTQPFCSETWHGDRVAVPGGDGSGKSAFLRPPGTAASSFGRFLLFAPGGTAGEIPVLVWD